MNHRRILAVLVIGKMPTGLIEFQFANVRREDLIVSLPNQVLQNEVLQSLSDEKRLWESKTPDLVRPCRQCGTAPAVFPARDDRAFWLLPAIPDVRPDLSA